MNVWVIVGIVWLCLFAVLVAVVLWCMWVAWRIGNIHVPPDMSGVKQNIIKD